MMSAPEDDQACGHGCRSHQVDTAVLSGARSAAASRRRRPGIAAGYGDPVAPDGAGSTRAAPPPIIRTASPDDASALEALLARPDVAPSVFGRPVSLDEVCLSVACEIAIAGTGGGHTFVCEGRSDDGAPLPVAGYAATIGGELSFAVHPACRRRGYGRHLVGHAIRHAFAHGIAVVTAEVVRDNAASARLLESLGFRRVGLAGSRHRPGAVLLRYRLHA